MECLYDEILLKVKVVFVIMAYLKLKWIVHVYCQIIFLIL